jgi:hypothetical protein
LITFFVALSFPVVLLHSLTLFALTFLCVAFQPIDFCSIPNLSHLRHLSILLHCSGFQFFSSWDEGLPNIWALPTFSNLANMSREYLTHPVAAAATSQVKLCPYDEEEPDIWFRLIEALFAAAGIKSQKLKYANALASLPKQVLQDILDTLDVCNESYEPFDFLKILCLDSLARASGNVTLNCFAFSWKCRASSPVFTWEHLPPGVSTDNDLFLAMLLIHLPSSMRETVGAGAHKTAAAMVKAADALWDAWGGHDPAVTAASTQQSRSPAPSSRKRSDKRVVMPAPKVNPLPPQIFIHFKILAMACVNFTITMPIGLTSAFRPVLGQKTNCHRTSFGSAAFPTHATAMAMHFPANAGLIFLTDKLTNDRYLVDTGATLSIVPCNQNSSPSGPLLKGADGQPIPSWGFI